MQRDPDIANQQGQPHPQEPQRGVARRRVSTHLFLAAFYQRKGSERVMFKGGTALRIVYGNPRFSEGVDFSGFGIKLVEIEDGVADAASALEMQGMSVNVEESKATSGGYLGILRCRLFEFDVQVQIGVSLRKRNGVQGQGQLISPELFTPYVLTYLPETLLVNEKISAVLTRAKPRDYFDLYFLLRKNMISPAQKARLKPVRTAIQNSKIDFRRELSQFLPQSHAQVIKDFREVLLAELRRNGI